MNKRSIIALIAVFIAWSILDFILHGLLLKSAYEATASLWRPMEDFNMALIYFVTFVFVAAFVGIYELLITPKSISSGIKFVFYSVWPLVLLWDSVPIAICRFP